MLKKQENKIEKLEQLAESITDSYVYVKYMARFYWLNQKKFFSSTDTANNLLSTPKELNELRESGVIPTYENICYQRGKKEGYLNMLDESSILMPSDSPILDENIKKLIENICGNKKENIGWLYKAILYKYTHINDFTIPCVVFFGKGGSGKGTFISLLATIFGQDNVMSNLGQRELTSQFDTYKGQKLVIEFAEVITNNTGVDKRIFNKLKNIIGAERITVNEKGVQPYQIENIVWAFISSNSNMPILLDDQDKGNRRFTIIRSDSLLIEGKKINESIKNKNIVSNFIAWLLCEYSEVIEYEHLPALNNQDKHDLESISQSDSSLFWEYYEEKYPDKKGKISIKEIEIEINKYCFINDLDERQFKRFIWKTSKYPKKRLRINKIPTYCVEI